LVFNLERIWRGKSAYLAQRSRAANLKIVITDHRFPQVDQERRCVEAEGWELVVGQAASEGQLVELCRDADDILAGRALITERVVAAMERCRIIVRYGIGVETIDIAAATNRCIMVANVPDYCIDEVSDHALALLLMLSRQMVPAMSLAKEDRWSLANMPPDRAGERRHHATIS
jgi:D-3-phosphoglycerate dehydrogenase